MSDEEMTTERLLEGLMTARAYNGPSNLNELVYQLARKTLDRELNEQRERTRKRLARALGYEGRDAQLSIDVLVDRVADVITGGRGLLDDARKERDKLELKLSEQENSARTEATAAQAQLGGLHAAHSWRMKEYDRQAAELAQAINDRDEALSDIAGIKARPFEFLHGMGYRLGDASVTIKAEPVPSRPQEAHDSAPAEPLRSLGGPPPGINWTPVRILPPVPTWMIGPHANVEVSINSATDAVVTIDGVSYELRGDMAGWAANQIGTLKARMDHGTQRVFREQLAAGKIRWWRYARLQAATAALADIAAALGIRVFRLPWIETTKETVLAEISRLQSNPEGRLRVATSALADLASALGLTERPTPWIENTRTAALGAIRGFKSNLDDVRAVLADTHRLLQQSNADHNALLVKIANASAALR